MNNNKINNNRKAELNGSALPLAGITILDLTRLIPGAFCTAILGDAGADVIKIEEPETGDYERNIHPFIGPVAARFLILNRNKKSVALNLKDAQGKEIFLKMVKKADVLVEGFRPGVMKKLGLDFESLHKVNPELMFCSISSFGHDGPSRDVVVHDINIMGMAGFFDVGGAAKGKPVIPGLQIADSTAGMNAAMAILIALLGRSQTSKGRFIDISMFDGVMSLMVDAARYVFAGQSAPGRGEGRLYGGFPNYNIYETKDGKYITVGSLEAKFKNALLKKLGRDDLAEKGRETTSSQLKESDHDLSLFLEKTFLTKTRDQWVKELGELNICVGPVNSLEEALSHPQTIFRNMVVDVEHPSAGKIKQIGSCLKISDMPLNPNRLPAPGLGEHTREILAGLGYGKEMISTLIDKNTIKAK